MASVWLRLVDVTVAEPPRTLTGFLHHEQSAASGRITAMPHPVYLVRHGQSQWNLRRLTQGQTAHPPLTDLGRSQSAAAAVIWVKSASSRRGFRPVAAAKIVSPS